MATSTLPPVNQSGAKSLTGVPSLGQSKRSNSKTPRVSPRHSIGKLAGIERGDVGAFRNTYQHNLSLEILQEGYVSSFIELFELFNQQKKDREAAASDSGLHEVPLLINQPEKLDVLKSKLIEAEDARRKGAPEKSYQSFLDLAHHFEQFSSDEWLTDHFHQRCMAESVSVKDDDGRKQAEANFNIGIALEKRGDLSAAVEYLEKFYNLTTDQEWQDTIGDSLHDQAALQLYRTYTSLAEEIYEQAPQMSIEYLKKAYHMANEGGDRTEAGLASHRLGNIYEAVGDPEVATMYHKGYLDRCKRDKDKVGAGKAYEALARCEQSDGKLEEASQNYLEFVKIAEEVADKGVISQACSSLANLYNMLGEYESAVEYYNKAAENMETDDRERLELMNISQAIARSHNTLCSYSSAILKNTAKLTASIVEWKDYRDEGFVIASRPATSAGSDISGANTPASPSAPVEEKCEEKK